MSDPQNPAVEAIEFIAGRALSETELRFLRENNEAAARIMIESLEEKFDLVYEPYKKVLVDGQGRTFGPGSLLDCLKLFRKHLASKERNGPEKRGKHTATVRRKD